MNFDRWMEAITDLAPYELDLSGRVSEWGSSIAGLMGYTSQEIIGREFSPFDDEIQSAESIVGVAAKQGRFEKVGRAARKDGSIFWADQLLMPIFDQSRLVVGYAGLLRDVTLWKQAEEERDRIFALSADLICVAGFDGFYKRVNPAFSRVLGFSESEIVGEPFIDFVHPDDVASTLAEASGLATGKETMTFRNRHRCLDGSYRWLEWHSKPVIESQLLFATAHDITEQKISEEKLKDYSRELERSNSELQQFAYVASHDLQEPLRAVAGCMQLFAERNSGKVDDKSQELIGHAVDGAKRMQILINDLLDFSRVGSKGISKAMIDPRLAVDKAVRQLQVAVLEADALITIHAMPQVFADSSQMTQLFQNLIGNAIKFRTEQRCEIRVSAEAEIGLTAFSVSDNGIGIPAEYQEKVFGIFQRLHSRREYSGTGIGLAICRKIVEGHGGRIWIESNPGEGTTFRFTIPDKDTHD